jgi:flavin reductase (DIM6/NTAB) family NADH-FMN oxidoreductase RutF
VALITVASERMETPRVTESKIQFGRELHTILSFARGHTIVGEVVLMHARDGVVRDGKIDPFNRGTLERIEDRDYCNVRILSRSERKLCKPPNQ